MRDGDADHVIHVLLVDEEDREGPPEEEEVGAFVVEELRAFAELLPELVEEGELGVFDENIHGY